MNLLELIPGISGIIDKIIPDPNKQQELKLELAKLDAQENIARMGMLGNMLSNKSFFVAGGIPAIIWLAVVYLATNYILFPLLAGLGMQIAPIQLPGEYWSLLQIVVVGLFGKKVIDGNEWRWGEKLISPAKSQVEAAAAKGDVTPVGAHAKPAAEKIVIKSPSIEEVDLSDINRRIEEEIMKRGIK